MKMKAIYTSFMSAVLAASVFAFAPVTALAEEQIDSVSMSLAAPVCGTQVADGVGSDGTPKVTNGEHYTVQVAKWNTADDGKLDGKIDGDATYHAFIQLRANEGWEWSKNPEVTITGDGAKLVSKSIPSEANMAVLLLKVEVPAKHAWNDGDITLEATTDHAGERTFTCTGCSDTRIEEIPQLVPEWSDPTYDWSDDKSSVTATRKSSDGTVETETVSTTEETDKPNCTDDGKITYTAKFENPAFETQTEVVTIETEGHKWDDGKVEKEPTCTEEGETLFTCTVCKDTKTEKVDALGHDWGVITYTWADDNGSVTAERVCKRDKEHIESETVTTTSEKTKPATCEGKGETTLTATFENKDFETQTKTVEIPALEHDWGEPTYEWADDNGSVTATRVCKNDKDHVETETVTTAETVTKAATCTGKGESTFTAKFQNKAFETQTKTAETKALGHDWGKVTYTWASDNGSVTAEHICKRDKEHIEDETVVANKETTAATCTKAGKTTSTATFKNKDFEKQTKVVETPALGHDWGEWKTTKKPTNTTPGERTRTCKRDASHVETEAIALNVSYSVAGGAKGSWTKGSTTGMDFVVRRNQDDNKAAAHFRGIHVDGKAVDSANYSVTNENAKVTLKASYLQKLADGNHTIKFNFDDGSTETTFAIKAAAQAAKQSANQSAKQSNLPKTGDILNQPLVYGLAAGGLAIVAFGIYRKFKNKE